MNVNTIPKPHPHCPIPAEHPAYRGYVKAEQTDIRRTFQRHAPATYGDDYDRVMREDYLSAIGGFK